MLSSALNSAENAARLQRLAPEEWAFGRPNASVIMASFLHPAATGARFFSRAATRLMRSSSGSLSALNV